MRTSQSDSLLETCHGDHIVSLCMNRPPNRNAISTIVYKSLTAAILKHGHKDSPTRVIILCGKGPTFCAGMDIKEALITNSQLPAARAFMHTLTCCPKLIYAVIHGACVGIGVTLLLHCDLVFAAAGTTLCTPFRALGLPPEFASSILFPRRLGPALATRMLCMGETVSAKEWRRAGALHPDAERDAAGAFAAALAHAREAVLGRRRQGDAGVAVGEGEMVWEGALTAKRLMREPEQGEVLRAIEKEFQEINQAFAQGRAQRLIRMRIAEMERRRASKL